MTAAAITGHWAFHGQSDRCTARTGHSAELSHRTTKVRGATQVKGGSHGLRTGGIDPLLRFELWRLTPALQRLLSLVTGCSLEVRLQSFADSLRAIFGDESVLMTWQTLQEPDTGVSLQFRFLYARYCRKKL